MWVSCGYAEAREMVRAHAAHGRGGPLAPASTAVPCSPHGALATPASARTRAARTGGLGLTYGANT